MGVERLYGLRHRAKRRGVPCSLSPTEWQAFEERVEAGEQCGLCGLPLNSFRYLRLLPLNSQTGYTADSVKAVCGRCAADAHTPTRAPTTAYTPLGSLETQDSAKETPPSVSMSENSKTRFLDGDPERQAAFQARIRLAQAAFFAAQSGG